MGLGKAKKRKKRKSQKASLLQGDARRSQVLDIVATDSTFRRRDSRFGEVWVGKCLFCSRKLTVSLSGDTRATVEHILSRNHGGTNDLRNVALACGSCNGEKGRNHDKFRHPDMDYINRLLGVRAERWRDQGD